ncbi:MAG: hypothetical protein IH840_12905 [Candidatus Heimdallarchaeota archaeon]|nr:hypothetical protein [Candidatus Heimdallarchaeota archaeon]
MTRVNIQIKVMLGGVITLLVDYVTDLGMDNWQLIGATLAVAGVWKLLERATTKTVTIPISSKRATPVSPNSRQLDKIINEDTSLEIRISRAGIEIVE